MSSDILIKAPPYQDTGRMGGGSYIDCGLCTHCIWPLKWPDKDKVFSCGKHKISLQIAVSEDGYARTSYICKDFDPAAGASLENAKRFDEKVRPMMEEKVLYQQVGNIYTGCFYKGIPFEKLPGKFPEDFK